MACKEHAGETEILTLQMTGVCLAQASKPV